jgi:hypothetical protein
LRLYQAMRPDVCRVTQYWNNPDPNAGIFSPDQLRAIANATGTEIILQSSEVPNWWEAKPQLQNLLDLVNEFPDKVFTFEIMNEPDQHPETVNDPDQAAVRAISCAQVLRRDIGGNHNGYLGYGPRNLWYAINQPSGNLQAVGKDDAAYFNTYNYKVWYGETVLDAAEISTVHLYGWDTLCRSSDPSSLSRKMYDWVRGLRPTKIVKITEAGIPYKRQGWDRYGNYGDIRGYDYLRFADLICDQHDGYWITDVVCVFGLPDTGDVRFNLTDADCNQIGTRDFDWAANHTGSPC